MKGKGLFYATSIHRTELNGPLQGARRMKIPFMPTPDYPLIISASEIGSFLRCRLQWNWRYRVGIGPKAMGPERGIGIYVHAGKEGFYALPRIKRTPEAMEVIGKAAIKKEKLDVPRKEKDLALAMMVGLAEWVTDDNNEHSDRNIGKREVLPEWEFAYPLDKEGSIIIRGKIDELFEPTIYKHTLAMDETKTRAKISFDMLDMDAQMTVYLWAMSQRAKEKEFRHKRYERFIGWRTIARRQMPGPRVKAALFGRESIERDQDELDMWQQDTLNIARDMLDAAIYPNKNDSCKWNCDFYQMCLVRANVHDLEAAIEEHYTIKEKDDAQAQRNARLRERRAKNARVRHAH